MDVSPLFPCVGADETEVPEQLPGDGSIHPVSVEEQASPVIEVPPQAQEEPLLSEQLHRVQTMEDIEALASEELIAEQEKPQAVGTEKPAHPQEKGRAAPKPAKKPATKKKMINLQSVLSGKVQEAQCPSLPVVIVEEVSSVGLSWAGGHAVCRAVTPISAGGWL